jgi:2-keto-4-pentenoate hydratase/2-oxohepta-3-ene-1,7-dioic acid hydratase in catechol pathway
VPYPFFADTNPTCKQFLVHARPAIFLLDLGMNCTHVGQFEPAIADMIALIEQSTATPALPTGRSPAIALDRVQVVAPLAPRRNTFCVGKNYRARAREFAGSGFEAGAVKGAEIDEFPAILSKPPSTVVGHLATVSLHPQATQAVDYEAELAVVIGKAGRDRSASEAMGHVWGCTIVNDVTASIARAPTRAA